MTAPRVLRHPPFKSLQVCSCYSKCLSGQGLSTFLGPERVLLIERHKKLHIKHPTCHCFSLGQSLLIMSTLPSAKRLGKRVIGYPEQTVPVVSTADWISQYTGNPRKRVCYRSRLLFSLFAYTATFQITTYLLSLFPIISWAPRYSTPNLHVCCTLILLLIFQLDFGWLTGDVIAGLTVGIVVVPQSMSYAQVYQLFSW